MTGYDEDKSTEEEDKGVKKLKLNNGESYEKPRGSKTNSKMKEAMEAATVVNVDKQIFVSSPAAKQIQDEAQDECPEVLTTEEAEAMPMPAGEQQENEGSMNLQEMREALPQIEILEEVKQEEIIQPADEESHEEKQFHFDEEKPVEIPEEAKQEEEKAEQQHEEQHQEINQD
jgi:hypothetical protein